VEFVERDGQVFRRNKRPGALTSLPPATVSGHAVDYSANETQYVFSKQDVADRVKVVKAEQMIATGVNDYIEAIVEDLGHDHFIMSGGVTGTVWGCTEYVGQTNLLGMLVDNPDLVDYLSKRILDQTIETIRRLAAAGGDAIFIDDAMCTSDMISVKHYERFGLPYVREMVREIHRLGQKAVVIYFGGAADRLEHIASTGADGFAPETSMKGYVNDIAEISERIGQKISLFGNVDPVGVLQNGSDAELEREVRRQALAGKKARGFIMSTGSPMTPATPLGRVRRFIELGRQECP
jgi:uroporphyrinogen decarboxylase